MTKSHNMTGKSGSDLFIIFNITIDDQSPIFGSSLFPRLFPRRVQTPLQVSSTTQGSLPGLCVRGMGTDR